MVRKVFRCAVGTLVFAWAVMVAGLVAIAGLVLMIVRGVGSLPLVITLLVLAVFGMVYLWRFALYPKIVVDDRLWVVNPLHTHILTADEVSDIRPGPNGLQVTHADGVVEAWAVQKSTGALKVDKPRRADRVAEELLAALHGPAISEAGATAIPTEGDDPEDRVADDDSDEHPDTPDAPGSFAAGDTVTAPDEPDELDDDEDDEDDEDLIIRRAHPDDLDILVALEEEVNTEALAHVFVDGTPFPIDSVTERWARALEDRSFKVRVAEIDGEPVGYLCYDADRVHQVGMVSRHSGRGHGRSLVEYATDDMAARGTSAAHLQVLEENEAARGFYRHLGWSETGDRRPCPYPPHPTELTMSLELDDRSA